MHRVAHQAKKTIPRAIFGAVSSSDTIHLCTAYTKHLDTSADLPSLVCIGLMIRPQCEYIRGTCQHPRGPRIPCKAERVSVDVQQQQSRGLAVRGCDLLS